MTNITLRFAPGIEFNAQLTERDYAVYVDEGNMVRLVCVGQSEDGTYYPKEGSIQLGKKLDDLPIISYVKATQSISLYEFLTTMYDSSTVINFGIERVADAE
ncbi:hypothetical protein Q9251_08150 [Alkalihalobacillus macyae]|uniref:hypothetical protein n=1 Tax=Guptibacillus hwajinpoensis TaxID=208199 RepID=UPI00273AB142|nr:hypothetical protein [Alkalihalobacillus macyae]MDP4550854.1 hypothetical protein [Alkalihalobacillus macyae]